MRGHGLNLTDTGNHQPDDCAVAEKKRNAEFEKTPDDFCASCRLKLDWVQFQTVFVWGNKKRPSEQQTAFVLPKPSSRNDFALGALFFDTAVDVPLLGDGQEVVDYPVQNQTGREEEEHDGENQRHDFHHFRLHRVG